jgi:murein DD-endopeptidase MepM/ murein hydrolase activator NlpD
MKYTVRYAHLDTIAVSLGQTLNYGDKIGVMGSTGQSFGAHLHIDVTRGDNRHRYTLEDIELGNPVADIRQLNYFIDFDLFKSKCEISTPYGDRDYQMKYKKVHTGYDVIPLSTDWTIFWNRRYTGTVTRVMHGDVGYGNCVYIAFEVR